jgi:hypothetical protein
MPLVAGLQLQNSTAMPSPACVLQWCWRWALVVSGQRWVLVTQTNPCDTGIGTQSGLGTKQSIVMANSFGVVRLPPMTQQTRPIPAL